MQVIKRNGDRETISFDKITKRISDLTLFPGKELTYVDPLLIAKETINGIFNGISTVALDMLSAEICATKSHHHPEYNQLGGRILSSHISKSTDDVYLNVVTTLYNHSNLSNTFYNFVVTHHAEIQEMFDYSRDMSFDFFSMKTLERSYLFKVNEKIVERPQHMWMRVAIQIHGGFADGKVNLHLLRETYDLLSMLYFTHATPTLFNSGTKNPQLSSCYLYSTEDNIEDIFDMIGNTAKISKWAGGIGLSLSNIRGKGTIIRGTNGKSDGIIPLCKTLETVGRYINQGGKRNGSIACYLEPWHSDIQSFVELRKNTGDENLRARDLFIALWVPDLFMKRVQADAEWTLMCPHECPGLVDSYGEAFETLYTTYEVEKKGKKTIRARALWDQILENQLETGMPYLSFKDSVNRKNMQRHLGVIRNSNLCVAPETMILTSKGYYPIESLVNQSVEVWNGEEFSETTILQTGTSQPLIKVVLTNGSEIECTPYHIFYTWNNGKIVQVKACDLCEGKSLIPVEYPILRNIVSNHSIDSIDLKTVPINGTHAHKLLWLGSFLDTTKDHTTQFNSPGNFFCVENTIEYINHVKYMLQTMGCNPFRVHFCLVDYLMISDKDLLNLYEMGCRSTVFTNRTVPYDKEAIHFICVANVVHTGRISDTFCFIEKKRGMGIFNGVLTGQCNEIALVSNKDNYAVCNLASICLPRFVENGVFNFETLQRVAGVITQNLNNVIDVNFYPTPETRKTNLQNRPIGIGVQGLADVYCMLGLSFASDEARALNKKIFETIYYGAVEKSIHIASEVGPYPSYENSPHSEGLLQFDFYENSETTLDWKTLKEKMKQIGIRNSLLTALMPTASTSQIMCNNECFEPFTSNIYVRKTIAGEFTIVNQHLIKDLLQRGLWNKIIYEEILYDNGSVQKIKDIPDDLKQRYKTAFELKMTDLLKQAVERAPFIDHMQSMNLFMAKPDFTMLNSSHFYSWKNGLKTGMYYLRTLPATDAVKFGLDPSAVARIKQDRKQILADAGVAEGVCPRNEYLRSICESCSS